MLKVFQLAIIFCVDWFTVIWLPEVAILPLPAVICPPVGNVPGSSAHTGPESARNAAMVRAPTMPAGPPPLATFSETTIHFSLTFDQI